MEHARQQDDEPVLSEVHMETCPPNTPSWSTRFCFSCGGDDDDDGPADAAELNVDADGDVLLPRRPPRKDSVILIHHSLAVPVSRCGEQVWLGACLLCDLLVQRRHSLAGAVVTELGAGVGLAALMAARFARRVFLTDGDDGALQLAAKNCEANAVAGTSTDQAAATAARSGHGQQAQQQQQQQQRVSIRRLDWLALFDVQLSKLPEPELLQLLNNRGSSASAAALSSQQQQPQQQQQQQQQEPCQAWTPEDLQSLAETSVWMAADVVYDEALTEAFVMAAHQLMLWQRQQPAHIAAGRDREAVLLVAVEKRYNFTLRDMDARATAFEHFMTYIQVEGAGPSASGTSASGPSASASSSRTPLFAGRRIEVAGIPQALQYDRSVDLELWELTAL